MQLIDFPQPQPILDSIESIPEVDRIQSVLQDIVDNVEIIAHHCVRHPDYKPLEIAAEALPRFQQLPIDLQEKFLNLQLRSLLYGIYYNASLRTALALDADSTPVALSQNLENNSFLGVDIAFYDRLHKSNCGTGYFNPGWQIVRQESDGAIAVHRHGLTLHVQRDELEHCPEPIQIGAPVAIRLPRNLVQNGFYMAVGNAGPHVDMDITRVYFNLTPDGAVEVMASLTEKLNAIDLPFSFKALYNTTDYQRYDSAVLYIQKSNYPTVHPILQAIHTEHRSHFQPEVPLFTKWIAPGLAIAEEPNHKFTEQESFGTNRCQLIVNALIEARKQGNESPEQRMRSIVQHFDLLNLDRQRPYLNAQSEDIYRVIEPAGF